MQKVAKAKKPDFKKFDQWYQIAKKAPLQKEVFCAKHLKKPGALLFLQSSNLWNPRVF